MFLRYHQNLRLDVLIRLFLKKKKSVTVLFRYVIENPLGISANSIPKCQALVKVNLSKELGIEMSESQSLNGNLEQGYFDNLLKIFGLYLLTAYPRARLWLG